MWTKLLGGGASQFGVNPLANIFGAADQSSDPLGGINWGQNTSLDPNNGAGLDSIINSAIGSANNGYDYTDPFSSGSITGVNFPGTSESGNWWDAYNNPNINSSSAMDNGSGSGVTSGTGAAAGGGLGALLA